MTEEISFKLNLQISLFQSFDDNFFSKNKISAKEITNFNKFINLVKDIRSEFTGKPENFPINFFRLKVPIDDNSIFSIFI